MTTGRSFVGVVGVDFVRLDLHSDDYLLRRDRLGVGLDQDGQGGYLLRLNRRGYHNGLGLEERFVLNLGVGVRPLNGQCWDRHTTVSLLRSNDKRVFTEEKGTYPFPSLRDDGLYKLVVVTFLVDGLIDDRLILRVFLLLNTSWGSDIRIDTSSDHFSPQCSPNARSATSYAVLRLLQRICSVVPHLIHLESQAIDSLLQQQILRLLVVQGTIRLLGQFKICGELVNPVLETLLLLVPFVCLDRMYGGGVGIFFDFGIPAAKAESVSF